MSHKPKKNHTLNRAGLLAGLTVLGFILARWLSRTVEDGDDATEARPAVRRFIRDERRYPPFIDEGLEGVQIEGEFDESGEPQLAIIGVELAELEQKNAIFALARRDTTGCWHPAVPARGLGYSKIVGPHGDVAAVVIRIGAGAQRLVLGTLHKGHFTPCRHTKLLGLTNPNGLLYDYPDMPIIAISD